MHSTLYRLYTKLASAITPDLRFSQSIYEDVLRSTVTPSSVWLDLGCGHQLLPSWRSEEEKQIVQKCKSVVGLDPDLSSLKRHATIIRKVAGDISALPFPDAFFDMVTANMVVEHLKYPENQFSEVRRVLKPGGVFVFHTPNAFGYPVLMARLVPRTLRRKLAHLLDGRAEEDVFETYYRANSRKEIRRIASRSSFEVQEIRMIASSAVFSMIPPVVVFELLFIRFLMTSLGEPLRTDMIAILRKKG